MKALYMKTLGHTALQYFYLLRWLLFHSTLMSILMGLLFVCAGASLWLFLFAENQHATLFYSLAAIIYALMMMNFHTRFGMLVARKTLALTGLLAWRLTVISLLLIAVLSLAVAPGISWTDGPGHWLDLIRGAILVFAVLTLLIYLGAITRLDLLLIAFALMTLGLSGTLETVVATAKLASRQGSIMHCTILLLLALALWAALYVRINNARLSRPLTEGLENPKPNDLQYAPMEQLLTARLMSRFISVDRIKSPASFLLMEDSRPVLGLFLISLATALPTGLIMGGIYYFFIVKESQRLDLMPALAALLVMLPMLQLANANSVAGNLRRLWLLVPGGRRELLGQLERSYIGTACLCLMPFVALSVTLLWIDNQPLWWLICWVALAPMILLLACYLLLWTLGRNDFLEPLAHFILTFGGIALIVLLSFPAPPPLLGAGLCALLLAAVLLVRHGVRQRWSRMDYSIMRKMVTRI